VTIRIYDLQGRRVFSTEQRNGSFHWSAKDLRGRPLANGVYQIAVQQDGFSMTNRIILLK
jgi:hypothetical protein